MKVMGAPWIARQMARRTYPRCEVTANGDHYQFKLTGTAMKRTTDFDIGKEFVEVEKCKVSYRLYLKHAWCAQSKQLNNSCLFAVFRVWLRGTVTRDWCII